LSLSNVWMEGHSDWSIFELEVLENLTERTSPLMRRAGIWPLECSSLNRPITSDVSGVSLLVSLMTLMLKAPSVLQKSASLQSG
jgi:hypothetical protein